MLTVKNCEMLLFCRYLSGAASQYTSVLGVTLFDMIYTLRRDGIIISGDVNASNDDTRQMLQNVKCAASYYQLHVHVHVCRCVENKVIVWYTTYIHFAAPTANTCTHL